MKKQRNERPVKDLVCEMEVSPTTAAADVYYQGKYYYFCAEACREAFLQEPEMYLKQHRQHGYKPK